MSCECPTAVIELRRPPGYRPRHRADSDAGFCALIGAVPLVGFLVGLFNPLTGPLR